MDIQFRSKDEVQASSHGKHSSFYLSLSSTTTDVMAPLVLIIPFLIFFFFIS